MSFVYGSAQIPGAYAFGGATPIAAGGTLSGDVQFDDTGGAGSLAGVVVSELGGAVVLDDIGVSGGAAVPGAGTGANAAEVWSYVLSNGKTAEQTVVEAHAMLTALLSGITSLPADVRAELESTAIPVNVKKVNDVVLQGTGTPGDSMRHA